MGSALAPSLPLRIGKSQFLELAEQHVNARANAANAAAMGSKAKTQQHLHLHKHKNNNEQRLVVREQLFINCQDDDLRIGRDELLKLARYTDVYLAHDWGIDEHGRRTHDRVRVLNAALMSAGLVTFFDEEEARRKDCIFDPELRMKEGIEHTQVVLLFITKRYTMLVGDEGPRGQEIDGKRAEFLHALRCKEQQGAGGFLRSLVPIVFEEASTSNETWGPLLLRHVGARLRFDLLDDFVIEPELVKNFVKFVLAAVGKPLLQGGPFNKTQVVAAASTAGRHNHWLKEYCGFDLAKARFYSELFAAKGIESTTRLYDNIDYHGVAYIKELGVTDGEDAARIAQGVIDDVHANISLDNQLGIDQVLKNKKEKKDRDELEETLRAEREREFIQEYREDEEMRRQDALSYAAAEWLREEQVARDFRAITMLRHQAAILYDKELRENEEMSREAVFSSQMRDSQRDREQAMNDMDSLLSPYHAVTHCRRIALRMQQALLVTLPGTSEESRLTSERTGKMLEEHYGTFWHQLIEEATHALMMVFRLAKGNPEVQKELGEKGVLKYVVMMLSPLVTSIGNTFAIRIDLHEPTAAATSSVTAAAATTTTTTTAATTPARSAETAATATNTSAATTESAIQFTSGIVRVSIAVAGLEAMRYLCRCNTSYRDATGENDRNVYLFGSSGAIETLLSIIKEQIGGFKKRLLITSKMLSLGALTKGRDRSRRSQNAYAIKKGSNSGGGGGVGGKKQTAYDEATVMTIRAALECLFCLAGSDALHPNRQRLEDQQALDVALSCTQTLAGEPSVLRWSCILLGLLYTEQTAVSNINTRLCRILIQSLRSYITTSAICEHGLNTVSFISFVATKAERFVGQEATLAALTMFQLQLRQKTVCGYFIENKACELAVQAFRHHKNEPSAIAAVCRCLGSLAHGSPVVKELLIELQVLGGGPRHGCLLSAAARQYLHHPRVMSEIFFAVGNTIQSMTSEERERRREESARLKEEEEMAQVQGGEGEPEEDEPEEADEEGEGEGVEAERKTKNSLLETFENPAILLVNEGICELLNVCIKEHLLDGDLAAMLTHAAARLLFGGMQGGGVKEAEVKEEKYPQPKPKPKDENVEFSLMRRFVSVNGCEALCSALINHTQRLDVFVHCAHAATLLAASLFDSLIGATNRLVHSNFCEALVEGLGEFAASATRYIENLDTTAAQQEFVIDVSERGPELCTAVAFSVGVSAVVALASSTSSRADEALKRMVDTGLTRFVASLQFQRVASMVQLLQDVQKQGKAGLVTVGMVLLQASGECLPRRLEQLPLPAPQDIEPMLRKLFLLVNVNYERWNAEA